MFSLSHKDVSEKDKVAAIKEQVTFSGGWWEDYDNGVCPVYKKFSVFKSGVNGAKKIMKELAEVSKKQWGKSLDTDAYLKHLRENVMTAAVDEQEIYKYFLMRAMDVKPLTEKKIMENFIDWVFDFVVACELKVEFNKSDEKVPQKGMGGGRLIIKDNTVN